MCPRSRVLHLRGLFPFDALGDVFNPTETILGSFAKISRYPLPFPLLFDYVPSYFRSPYSEFSFLRFVNVFFVCHTFSTFKTILYYLFISPGQPDLMASTTSLLSLPSIWSLPVDTGNGSPSCDLTRWFWPLRAIDLPPGCTVCKLHGFRGRLDGDPLLPGTTPNQVCSHGSKPAQADILTRDAVYGSPPRREFTPFTTASASIASG